jgi:hypothetical protein
MDENQKNELKQAAQAIASTMAKWERVREIAKDIVAYTAKDARRFVIQPGSAVGTKIVYGFVTGTEKYISYDEELNETPLRQIYERFFNDDRALVNMIEQLASAIAEVAEEEIRELKERLK